MPSFCAICAVWRLFLRPDAQISAVTVSADPAGCTASQRRPCTATRYAHDNGAPSIFNTEAAERMEKNTLSKARRNSQTPQKRLKTLKNAISRRFPTENTPPETGSRTARTRYSYERRAAVYLHGHVRHRAHIRIATIRPKVAKVADSRKVDSRRIVGKSPESRKSLQSRQKVVESRSIVVNSRTIVAKVEREGTSQSRNTLSFHFPL